ncbi:MAG: two-component system response regulator PilR (NtrC family) [Paraglaciecola psychrophila]|jgi:two-component system response regulator PilR (NtrC family)
MTKHRVLIVDDEPDIRELLEITLNRMGLLTESAADVGSAIELLRSEEFNLCLTDMNLPDGNGVQIIEYIQLHCPGMPVAMITAYGNTEVAIAALKAGAFDFVNKPLEIDRLRTLVDVALKLDQVVQQVDYSDQVQLLGETEIINSLRKKVTKLARSQAPVYISGESGSGKEVVARLIHANGARGSYPFIPVNCGAIPSELMESEFFGHVKGSFTGALENKMGLFEAAQGGTLFLDEVADLPLPMQVKLLRAIQEKAIRKVGSNDEVSIDVRILSATHKDLHRAVEAERFRSDLFYRINVIELRVPPLRERREDIALLADAALTKLSREWQLDKPALSAEAQQLLAQYDFPGNVRELENTLERAYTLCEGATISADDLQLSAASRGRASSLYSSASDEQAFGSLDDYLQGIEKEAIAKALEKTRWNKTAAAQLLGISFRQLRHRLKKLDLDND